MTEPTVENKFAANLEVALFGKAAFPERYLETLREMYARTGEDHYANLMAAILGNRLQQQPAETAHTAMHIVTHSLMHSPAYIDLMICAHAAIEYAKAHGAIGLQEAGLSFHALYNGITQNSHAILKSLSDERKTQLEVCRTVSADSLLNCARAQIANNNPVIAEDWARMVWGSNEDGLLRTMAGDVRLDAAEKLLEFSRHDEAMDIVGDFVHHNGTPQQHQRGCELMMRCADSAMADYAVTHDSLLNKSVGNWTWQIIQAATKGTPIFIRAHASLLTCAKQGGSHPDIIPWLDTYLDGAEALSDKHEAADLLERAASNCARQDLFHQAVVASSLVATKLPKGDPQQVRGCEHLLNYAEPLAKTQPDYAAAFIRNVLTVLPISLRKKAQSDFDRYVDRHAENLRAREDAKPKRPGLSLDEANALIAKLRGTKSDAAAPI